MLKKSFISLYKIVFPFAKLQKNDEELMNTLYFLVLRVESLDKSS